MARRFNFLAWTILGTVFVGMSIYLILNPTRTGVVPNYRFAASHWWTSESMYPGKASGYLYSPSFAVLFSFVHFLRPPLLGEILWRAFGFGLFALALRSLSTSRFQPPTFLPLVLLALPASLASLNNGQTNLPLSACLVLSALALREQKWNLAALLLGISLVLKPIALAPWLLAFAALPAMRIPLILGLPGWGLLGFLNPNFAYAWSQWAEFFHKLVVSYAPDALRVSDLFGALEKAGIFAPPWLEKGTRVAACFGALVYVWKNFLRQGLAGATWALWAATAMVFTVFNPRVETNSYVLISPLLAYAAISYWRETDRGKWKGIVLAAACIGLMCDGMGLWIYKATDVWFKPLIVLLVSPLLIRIPEGWKGEGGKGQS